MVLIIIISELMSIKKNQEFHLMRSPENYLFEGVFEFMCVLVLFLLLFLFETWNSDNEFI